MNELPAFSSLKLDGLMSEWFSLSCHSLLTAGGIWLE